MKKKEERSKDVLRFRMKVVKRILLVIIVLMNLSCGIFEPRDSSAPENPVPWVSYPH